MAEITVWSKQHENVLKTLREEGRYTVREEYIRGTLEEHSALVLEVYRWLSREVAKRIAKPDDVSYPVWVSFSREATMLPEPGTVILQLSIEESLILPLDLNKWGAVLNYAYIPADEADGERHRGLLRDYRTDDAQAYLSRFYPDIKREIVASWTRLFDDNIVINNRDKYGIVWELRREWLVE